MKKILFVILASCSIMGLVACGSSDGGGSTTQQMINGSMSSFFNIVDYINDNWDQQCTQKAIYECSCPSGGTADVNEDFFDATLIGCTSSDGQSFTGTLDVDQFGDDATISLNPAGDCTSISGIITDTGDETYDCSGTLNFNCNGAIGTCNVSTNCEECTIATSDGGDIIAAAVPSN